MPPTAADTVTRAPELRALTQALFRAGGSPAAEAELLARLLVTANLAGHDSHGVARAPQYLAGVRGGVVNPGVTPRLAKDAGPAAVLDGGYGYGQTVAMAGVEEALRRARAHRIGLVGVRAGNHMGRLADYARHGAAAGQVTLIFAASGGFNRLVAPFGGREKRLNTNPLAAGIPVDGGPPACFDISTSASGFGKISVALATGQPLPPGQLLDAEGQPSTDPADLKKGGALLPFGGEQGYKGYLLNVMIEVLAGILTDGGFMGHPKRQAGGNSVLVLCLDAAAMRPDGGFAADVAGLIAYLKATGPLPGQEVLGPGESSARSTAQREREGIPLPAATVAALRAECERYGVDATVLNGQ